MKLSKVKSTSQAVIKAYDKFGRHIYFGVMRNESITLVEVFRLESHKLLITYVIEK